MGARIGHAEWMRDSWFLYLEVKLVRDRLALEKFFDDEDLPAEKWTCYSAFGLHVLGIVLVAQERARLG